MDRKIGIELEVVSSDRDLVDNSGWTLARYLGREFSGDFNGRGWANRNVSQHWDISTDITVNLDNAPNYAHGAEIISPPIVYDAMGKAWVNDKLDIIASMPVTANRTCGLHVHIDVSDLTYPQYIECHRLYLDNQALIDTIMPPSRKSTSCTNSYLNNRTTAQTYREVASISNFNEMYSIGNRYTMLNAKAYAKYGTLEFRQHGGTAQKEKVIMWLDFCLALVNLAVANVQPVQVDDTAMLIAGDTKMNRLRPNRTRSKRTCDHLNATFHNIRQGMCTSVEEIEGRLTELYGEPTRPYGGSREIVPHYKRFLAEGWIKYMQNLDVHGGVEAGSLLDALPQHVKTFYANRAVKLIGRRSTEVEEAVVRSMWGEDIEIVPPSTMDIDTMLDMGENHATF